MRWKTLITTCVCCSCLILFCAYNLDNYPVLNHFKSYAFSTAQYGAIVSPGVKYNISEPLSAKESKPVMKMKNNSSCMKKKVRLSEHSLPITGLLSFPGSGNTWTRHLIQQMSGLGTSSCYCDHGLEKGGFPFECYKDRSKTLVVKTHVYRHAIQYTFKKIVLLVRNPYDSILSFVSFSKAGHTGRPSMEALTQEMKRKFGNHLKWYLTVTNDTVSKFTGPVHVLQYEQLKTDLSTTLTELANFLNVNITKADIDCTVKLQEGNFHRNGSASEHLQLLNAVYNKDQLSQMKAAAKQTEQLIKDTYGVVLDVGSSTENSLFV